MERADHSPIATKEDAFSTLTFRTFNPRQASRLGQRDKSLAANPEAALAEHYFSAFQFAEGYGDVFVLCHDHTVRDVQRLVNRLGDFVTLSKQHPAHEGHQWERYPGGPFCRGCSVDYYEWYQAEIQRLKEALAFEEHNQTRLMTTIEDQGVQLVRLTQQLAAQREVAKEAIEFMEHYALYVPESLLKKWGHEDDLAGLKARLDDVGPGEGEQ